MFLSKESTCSPQLPPLGHAVPIFSSLCLYRHESRQSLVCVFQQIHVVMRRSNAMYIYSQCWRIIVIGRKCQAAQWTRVRTRGNDDNSVRTLQRFVNFYFRRGKILAKLPPHYARISQSTGIDVLNRSPVLAWLYSDSRSLKDEAKHCQSRISKLASHGKAAHSERRCSTLRVHTEDRSTY